MVERRLAMAEAAGSNPVYCSGESSNGKTRGFGPLYQGSNPCSPSDTLGLMTKFCKDCQTDKSLDEFPISKRGSQGRNTYCKLCSADRTRAHKKAIRANPYALAQYQKRQREWIAQDMKDNPERYKERDRRYNAKLAKDPKRKAVINEGRRLDAQIKAMDEGRKVRRMPVQIKIEDKDVRLPSGPFMDWVQQRRYHYQTLSDFVKACGVPERSLTRLHEARTHTVSCIFVDKVLTNEGSTALWELYPDL